MEMTESTRDNSAQIVLTEREAATQLGLSVATLRAWRHHGKGPRFARFGRAVRYLSADLAEYIRNNIVNPRDGEPTE